MTVYNIYLTYDFIYRQITSIICTFTFRYIYLINFQLNTTYQLEIFLWYSIKEHFFLCTFPFHVKCVQKKSLLFKLYELFNQPRTVIHVRIKARGADVRCFESE